MFLIRWLSYLPLGFLYFLGDILFILGYYVVGYRKSVVQANMKNCFPDKSPEELKKIERGFYRRLGEFLAESTKAISISKEEIKRRVVFENPEAFLEPHKKGNSALVCACHQFNWEWALMAGILHLETPIDPIYMKLSSQGFNKLIYHIRSRFGGKPIEMKESGLRYARSIKANRSIANVGDQIPPLTGSEIRWVPFFGIETAWFTGQEQLSKMFKMNPIFLWVERPNRGFYKLKFIQLWDPETEYKEGEITENYANLLEEMIRANPTDWLWSHKRWKHKKSDFVKARSEESMTKE